MDLSNLRFLILFLLFFNLTGCRSNSDERYKTAFSEATKISDQQSKVMMEWAREFSQVFTEQNRAQFPSNRDWLNSRAQKIIPLIDESLRLNNQALEKYEEAGRLMSKDQDRRGMALIVASFRKGMEIEQMVKAQAQLASDQTITDAKAFNEKFSHYNELIQQKQKERDEQFDEGKRLMMTK